MGVAVEGELREQWGGVERAVDRGSALGGSGGQPLATGSDARK